MIHSTYVAADGRVFTIEVTPSRYRIKAGGEVVHSGCPPAIFGGGASDLGATIAWAVADIEDGLF